MFLCGSVCSEKRRCGLNVSEVFSARLQENTGLLVVVELKFYWRDAQLSGKDPSCWLLICCSGGSKDQITSYPDIEKFRLKTGASSVMIAREAQWDMSIFRKEGRLPQDELIRDYLKYVSI